MSANWNLTIGNKKYGVILDYCLTYVNHFYGVLNQPISRAVVITLDGLDKVGWWKVLVTSLWIGHCWSLTSSSTAIGCHSNIMMNL